MIFILCLILAAHANGKHCTAEAELRSETEINARFSRGDSQLPTTELLVNG